MAAPFSGEARIRGSNLRLLGLRADSGRLLGLRELKEQLLDLPVRRALAGGMEWISERLIGRIRFLIDRLGMALDLRGPLDALETALRPHADQAVMPHLGSEVGFSIASVLNDISLLRGRGDTHLNLWWEEYRADDRLLHDPAEAQALLNVFYRRLQVVYKEVIEHNFEAVSANFGFYTSLPVRWDIALHPPREGSSWASMLYRWRPVASWEEAGADVEFVSDIPDRFRQFDFSEAQAQLRALGRLTEKSQVWAGSGPMPSFDGHSILGVYTGDTPVLTEVCEYIEDDVKRLFDSAPGRDIP